MQICTCIYLAGENYDSHLEKERAFLGDDKTVFPVFLLWWNTKSNYITYCQRCRIYRVRDRRVFRIKVWIIKYTFLGECY